MTVGIEYKSSAVKKGWDDPASCHGWQGQQPCYRGGMPGARLHGLLEPPNNLIAAMFEVEAAP